MAWRVAKCLETLRSQVNAKWPNRDKSSDGTIGDAAHAATHSEHNPDANGVVRAMDITHDPAHGLDARKLAETLVASRDSRILYIISNAQIVSSAVSPWVWRPYSGINAHRHHVHISVVASPGLYDDTRPWNLGVTAPVPIPTPRPPAAGPNYRSLIGGYFSSPSQNGVVNASIWSNNPGAINGATIAGDPISWVRSSPGFVKTVVIGGGNPIAVFETPEQGMALWYNLMKRYRNPKIWPPVSTVQGIVNRYGGGQDYSAYVKFVCDRTGFEPNKIVDLDDDKILLPFAKAMFRFEAGVETPLSDAQIVYGFNLGRGKVSSGMKTTLTVGVVAAGGYVAHKVGVHPYAIAAGVLAVFGLVVWLIYRNKGE